MGCKGEIEDNFKVFSLRYFVDNILLIKGRI